MATHSVLKDHHTLRRRAAEVVVRVAELADEEGGTVTHQQTTLPRGQYLRQLAAKLDNNVFVLAVVGEFSRGKSSLINALLDRPGLLPTSIEPTTAAITILSYAPEPRVTVTFKDGTRRDDLSPEDLARYAVGYDLDGRERHAAAARRAAGIGESWVGGLTETTLDISLDVAGPRTPPVATIHVGVPSPFLRDGICLVDTPGIGSVNPEHGEATRGFIDKADAVLFLVNTDPVISQSECNFLAFLRDYVNRFLFIVTKIDRFSPRERQQSVAYTARTIEQHAGLARPPIYPVSAKLAILGRAEPDEVKYAASGFPVFLNALHRFLVEARGQEFLNKHAGLALGEVQGLINATLVELQGLRMSLEELPGSIDAARSALRHADLKRRDILTALGHRLRRIDAAMESFSPPAKVRLELQLASEVERLVDGYDWEQLQRVSETMPILIRDILATRLGADFARAAEQLVAMRSDILDACRQHLGEVSAGLRLRFEGLRLPQQMTVSLDFDANELKGRLQRIGTVTIGSTLALTIASIVAVGPLGAVVVLGGLVARHTLSSALRNDVKRRLKMSVGPALDRLLKELFQKVRDDITQTAEQFRQEVEEFLQGATAGIDQTLARLEQMRPVSMDESGARQHRLRVRLAELEELQRELEALTEPDW
ncbi:MAG TPA: dynamin family protein [Gemmataceae bacterium]|nr:dynamin family protein [Gemmataceae bacterium]